MNMPDEIWEKIFSYSDRKDLDNFEPCCRKFKRIILGSKYLPQKRLIEIEYGRKNDGEFLFAVKSEDTGKRIQLSDFRPGVFNNCIVESINPPTNADGHHYGFMRFLM